MTRHLYAAPAVMACSCATQLRDVLGQLVDDVLRHHRAGHLVYVQAVMA